MQTTLSLALLLALTAPAAAQDVTANTIRALYAERDRIEREIERQTQVEREREQAERERERQQEQAQRAREQQQEQAQRAREQAQRERERQQEQAQRAREQQQEQAQRAREQQQEQAQRAREQAERDRERARNQRRPFVETERATRTFRIGTAGELYLANVVGDITISRGTGNEAHVEMIKTARGTTTEEAKEALGLVTIDIVERPNRAELKTIYPGGDEMRRGNRRNVDVSVAFNVTVPTGTRVRANSISGAVSAKDVKGDLVLKSVSGAVRLANGGGSGTAESISGSVEVLDSAFDAAMSASTASGSITLRRVKAKRLAVHSISGSLAMDDVDCQVVEGQTVSGTVQFGGTLSRNGRYELSSHSGTLNVAVGAGTGFAVEATSFSGSVRSDYEFAQRDREPAQGRMHRSLRGVHGDGSAVLELSTFSGSINILKR
jgi:Putative adhesin